MHFWRKHTAEALEIVLREDSDDNSMVNSTEVHASLGSLDDKIELQSSSSGNAFEMDENNYVDRFLGDHCDEGENGNPEYNR